MRDEILKQALQKNMELDFPVGKSVRFYEKLTPGFKGKYSTTPKNGIIVSVKHPFIEVQVAGESQTHLLYQGEIIK